MAFRRIQKFFSFLCFRANKTISKQDDEPKITKIFFEDPCPAISVNPPVSITSEQAESPFLQKLPLEIRRLIYQHVWADPKKEYNYHHPYGRHVSYIRGRWFSRRCVMYSIDDDLNTIQSEMDAEYDEKKLERLRLCHMRLRSSWGHRHWRCEQRSWRPLHGIDKTGFISLMTVCKRLSVSSPPLGFFHMSSSLITVERTPGTPRSCSQYSSPTSSCSTMSSRRTNSSWETRCPWSDTYATSN